MKKFFSILFIAPFCVFPFISCSDEDAPITPEESSVKSLTDESEELPDTLFIPIQQTTKGYAPIVETIEHDAFVKALSDGCWWEHERRWIFDDGSTSNPIRTYGGSSTIFTRANGTTLWMAFFGASHSPGYDKWQEHLTEFPMTYDEETNTFTYGSGKPHQTFTILSINEDEMCCTQAADEILINYYNVEPHVLQYVVFKHYKTEEEINNVIEGK